MSDAVSWSLNVKLKYPGRYGVPDIITSTISHWSKNKNTLQTTAATSHREISSIKSRILVYPMK